MIYLIAAIDLERGIGKDNELLYKIKKDMDFFKEVTMGQIVIMGRNTQESLPLKKLKGRKNIVLTTENLTSNDDEVQYSNDISSIVELGKKEDIFIIGGEIIYREFIHHADFLLITQILEVRKANKYFPRITSEFELKDESKIYEEDGIKFYFETWERA